MNAEKRKKGNLWVVGHLLSILVMIQIRDANFRHIRDLNRKNNKVNSASVVCKWT